jgi:uncharacterized membrane protein YsdA (DUF1294 family)/cold shock CspA family protein
MKRLEGVLATWNDDRGFGFIELDGTAERIFVHIRAITEIAIRPRVGDRLTFVLGQGQDGRVAARDVIIVGANPGQTDSERRALLRPHPLPGFGFKQTARLVLAAVILAQALLAGSSGQAHAPMILFYLSMGMVSGAAYWLDKSAAQAGAWRVSENTLHFLDLIGGIAGGLTSQALLRHKISKPGFTLLTVLIIVLHFALLATLILGLWDIPSIFI